MKMKVKEVKTPETLTLEELMNLVNDLHALMWYGDGCEICAHCETVYKEPYHKTICKLKECKPMWRGFGERTVGER